MIFRVISAKEEIPMLEPNEKYVHFAFRPSSEDFFKLVDRCPKVEVVQVPPSYMKILSKSILIYLEMQRITVKQGNCWGARKDLAQYYDSEKKKMVQ